MIVTMVFHPKKAIQLIDLESTQSILTLVFPIDEDPSRLGCQYPLMAVGMESGNVLVFDMRSGESYMHKWNLSFYIFLKYILF